MTVVAMGRPRSEPLFPSYRPFPNEEGRNWRQEHLEIPLMLTALSVPNGGRVLEVGCGRGIALPVLARRLRPARLVGLDIDPALLAIARAHTGGQSIIELAEGDVRRLPFAAETFDLVVDFGTSFHVDRPATALREIARVLTPGGWFVTETKLSQWLSHPTRIGTRFLPWSFVPELIRRRHVGLWQARQKVGC